jgi:hypothetical protein
MGRTPDAFGPLLGVIDVSAVDRDDDDASHCHQDDIRLLQSPPGCGLSRADLFLVRALRGRRHAFARVFELFREKTL